MNNEGNDISVDGYTPPRGQAGGAFGVLTGEIDDGYFAATRIPILSGRGITAADIANAPRVAVVNQAFVKEFLRGADAVGRTFHLDSSVVTIVGVAPNTKQGRLDELPRPFVYFPLAQRWSSSVNIVVRAEGDLGGPAAAIRRELKALDPTLPPPNTTTLRQAIAVVLLPQRVAAAVTTVLGAAGLLLTVVGLYGVLAFSAAQRTREIGVRMALGAARRHVLGLVVGEGMRLTAAGMAIGLVLALGATQALKPFLFGVSPVDALTFVAIASVLALAALLASYLPARRAAAVDPARSLRED
jgi:predicted permease